MIFTSWFISTSFHISFQFINPLALINTMYSKKFRISFNYQTLSTSCSCGQSLVTPDPRCFNHWPQEVLTITPGRWHLRVTLELHSINVMYSTGHHVRLTCSTYWYPIFMLIHNAQLHVWNGIKYYMLHLYCKFFTCQNVMDENPMMDDKSY